MQIGEAKISALVVSALTGVGLTLSRYGIQTFTRPRAWHLRRG